MKFTKAPDTDNYHRRFVSENGIWEMGLPPRLFRWEVGFSKVGAVGPVMTYDCGEDLYTTLLCMQMLMVYLEKYTESATEEEILKRLPKSVNLFGNNPNVSRLSAHPMLLQELLIETLFGGDA